MVSNVGKYSLIALMLIIVAGGGVSWLTKKPAGQIDSGRVISKKVEPGEISNLLIDLRRETEINFSEIESVEFNWLIASEGTSTDQIDVPGRGFAAWEISDAQQRFIENFFESQGFEIDLYNIFAGTISGATGYTRGSIVCLVSGGVSGGDEGLERVPVVYDVEVRCGELGRD